MSLDSQYVTHLRRAAGAREQYVCVYCKEKAPISGRQSFREHLESTHSEIVESQSGDPSFDLQTWREQAINRSRVGGSVVGKEGTETSHATPETASSTTKALDRLSLAGDSKKKPTPRKIAPRERPQAAASPGAKRPRSQDDYQKRSSKSHNPRRAAPRGEIPDSPNQLNRANTFQSNFSNGQPKRELFNPLAGNTSTAATAGQVTLPSRNAPTQSYSSAPSSDFPPRHTPASSQHGQSTSERGVLPNVTTHHSTSRGGIAMPIDPRWPDMLLQPDSRPISQEQLAAEVKSIYAGLTMVESKCIHVDKAQAVAIREQANTKISIEHWQALIALHRTLLHEHHDFFLASQHPSASPALRRLASKYSMPARMWKHGIHSFLELLRYRLPDSLEFMISFIYTAYQMMSLLYETVPAFENTWIECLGDLGRYRMAIEDEDVRDRDTWANVARMWYTKAADRSPDVGRLYHHLAILARPNALQQLSLYSRSLIAAQVFNSARESILTLFNPLMAAAKNASSQISQLDTSFIKAHALLFNKEEPEQFQECRDDFLEHLDAHVGRVTAKWREQGAFVIISCLASLFDYGNQSDLRRAFDRGFHAIEKQTRASTRAAQSPVFDAHKPVSADASSAMEDVKPSAEDDDKTRQTFNLALELTFSVTTLVLKRQGDKNVLPFVHILMAFLLSLANIRSYDTTTNNSYAANSILQGLPREEICSFLNVLAQSHAGETRYEIDEFVRMEKDDSIPLPEDHLIRGQVWSQDYFPSGLFKTNGVDEDEKNIEHASTVRVRGERVLNLGFRLAKRNIGICYDAATRMWSAATKPTIMNLPDNDVVMGETSDPGYASENDTPEMNALKRGGRGRQPATMDGNTLAVPTDTSEQAASMMQKGVTHMVIDQQVMMQNQDLLTILVQNRWSIVISDQAMHEVDNLSKAGQAAAEYALNQVRVAYEQKDLWILNSKGDDITNKHMAKDTRTGTPPCRESKSADADDNEQELFGVTRRATSLSLQRQENVASQVPGQGIRPAILLTEDKPTRLRAAKEKLAALAPTALKEYLENGVRRMRSLSGASQRGPPASPIAQSNDRMDTAQ